MSKIDLSKYDNSWYNHGSLLRRLLWLIFGRVFVNTYLPVPTGLKVFILRLFGAKVGEHTMIKPKVNIKYPWFLEIGDYAWIGEQVWIDNLDTVSIGAHACISQGALLLTGNHNYKLSTFDLIVGKIVLKDGVWIGAKSIVAPGLICEEQSVLSAGSVLTENMNSNEIWRGNPAKLVRKREILK